MRRAASSTATRLPSRELWMRIARRAVRWFRARSAPDALVRARGRRRFFGLALDNLVQLLVFPGLPGVLGFPRGADHGRILPGAAVSILVGKPSTPGRPCDSHVSTGRNDVCALPYGIDTSSLFAHVFLVMLPARLAAEAAGGGGPGAGGVARGPGGCFGSGAIELLGSTVSERVRRSTPRAALPPRSPESP